MKTIQSMADLHNQFSKIAGPVEAKELLVSIVYNSIAEIQEEGIPFTAEELDKRINIGLNDFLDVIKKKNQVA
jgi:hypothetical protein